ncbi:DoxX-like family protein [Methyloceanibacter sp.]|uniref:DoxX-like family protein n=1 Tax=Methyloceanibacter sp. TaxID=1965321 RepID=UPI00351B86AF
MRYDTLVDGAEFARARGVKPKSFTETLRAWPATLQDRLHARSFFAVPLLHVILFWILVGILSLLPQSFYGCVYRRGAGFSASFARTLVAGASIADIVLGVLFLVPGWVRGAGEAMVVLSAIHLVGLSAIALQLWTEHFGALLKVVPMMADLVVIGLSREALSRAPRPSKERARPSRGTTDRA